MGFDPGEITVEDGRAPVFKEGPWYPGPGDDFDAIYDAIKTSCGTPTAIRVETGLSLELIHEMTTQMLDAGLISRTPKGFLYPREQDEERATSAGQAVEHDGGGSGQDEPTLESISEVVMERVAKSIERVDGAFDRLGETITDVEFGFRQSLPTEVVRALEAAAIELRYQRFWKQSSPKVSHVVEMVEGRLIDAVATQAREMAEA